MSLRSRLIRLAHAKPELRPTLLPLVKAYTMYGSGFDMENDEWGLMFGQHGNMSSVRVFYPVKHIGKRGKRVKIRVVQFFNAPDSRTAWAPTFEDRVKVSMKAKAVEAALDKLIEEAKESGAKVQESTEEVKGVEKGLPWPKIHHVEVISGPDITVDLNSNPMRMYSKSLKESLERGHQIYRIEINQRFQKRVMALRDELEKAKNDSAATKILADNGIKFKMSIYMDPMWQ